MWYVITFLAGMVAWLAISHFFQTTIDHVERDASGEITRIVHGGVEFVRRHF